MRGAVVFDLLESLLVIQHVISIVGICRCRQFPVVRQRCLELPFFVGIKLGDLVAPCLRCKLNALLLRLLHETSTSRFRQRHGNLLNLRVEFLGVFLPLTECIFTLHVEQAGIRVCQKIAGYLA